MARGKPFLLGERGKENVPLLMGEGQEWKAKRRREGQRRRQSSREKRGGEEREGLRAVVEGQELVACKTLLWINM